MGSLTRLELATSRATTEDSTLELQTPLEAITRIELVTKRLQRSALPLDHIAMLLCCYVVMLLCCYAPTVTIEIKALTFRSVPRPILLVTVTLYSWPPAATTSRVITAAPNPV